jgi:hypothetical protein
MIMLLKGQNIADAQLQNNLTCIADTYHSYFRLLMITEVAC